MQCPDCGNTMNSEPQETHYEAGGDVYRYYWCPDCEGMYETCTDYRDEQEAIPTRCNL